MRMLFWLVLIYVGYRIIKGFMDHKKLEQEPEAEAQPVNDTYKDPVCGVYIAKDDAVIGNLEGEKIYFCSMECLQKFQEQLQHKHQHHT